MASSTSSPDPLPHRSKSDPLPSLGHQHENKVTEAAQKATESFLPANRPLQDNPLAGRVKPGTIPPLSRLTPELQAWLDDPAVTGKKQEAIQRIEHAIAHPKEKKLLLNGLGLTKAPPLACLANRLKHVDFSDNKLTAFPLKALAGCKKLTTLILAHNMIKDVSPKIEELRQLQVLDLSYNSLSALPEEIGFLLKLEELNLSSNALWYVPTSFPQLSNLRILNISGNQTIVCMPFTFWEAPNLNVIRHRDPGLSAWLNDVDFKGNKTKILQRIEAAAQTKATELDLHGLELSQLPPLGFLADHVRKLDLSKNHFTSLPIEALKELPKLRTLDLSRNQLKELSPDIALLKPLTSLRLSNNKLTELPEELGQLSNLTALDIANNNLGYFPASLANLEKLGLLVISGNSQVADMPFTFLPNPDLQIIR